MSLSGSYAKLLLVITPQFLWVWGPWCVFYVVNRTQMRVEKYIRGSSEGAKGETGPNRLLFVSLKLPSYRS